MKKGIFAALAVVALSGCSVFVDVSASAPLGGTREQTYMGGDINQPTRDGFAGEGAIVRAALVAERDYFNGRVRGYCELSHTSNSHSGWPRNSDPEGYIHAAGCGGRVRIW